MAKQLDPRVGEVLKSYGFNKNACWDCHGTWVVYHKVLEQIAAKAGIEFEAPVVLEANGREAIVAICVTGKMRVEGAHGAMQTKTVWSIGEAAPKNNKNSYPWAMAEKRAVDRVILKLIGLHGFVYSEEEADDFKAAKDTAEPVIGALTKTDLQKSLRAFDADLRNVSDLDELHGLLHSYSGILDQCKQDMPSWWFGDEGKDFVGMADRIEAKRLELEQAA